jgi:non-canonical poly(A) RNA polymerase PAPD5/7
MQVDGVSEVVVGLLNDDIEEMAEGLETIAERRRPWQLAVAERIKATVDQLFPGATANLFGSLATGLAAPCSDVDMVVQNLQHPPRVAMRMLYDRLQHQGWVQKIQAVDTSLPVLRLSTAQIPISFGNQGSLINVDISFDGPSHRGLRTSMLVRDLIKRYPPIKPLALVLKQFLVEKGLNDPFVGGLSSYGLVIMIAQVLQRQLPAGMPPDDERVLGAMFVLFLREFASPGFVTRGVWLTQGAASPGEDARNAQVVERLSAETKAPLCILDPLEPGNNIGRTCFGVWQVVQAFAEALEAIQLTSAPRTELSSWSILGSVFSTGHHRHVVSLVTQVWCPRENPVAAAAVRPPPQRPQQLPPLLQQPSQPLPRTAAEWAVQAKLLLDQIDKGSRPCAWCQSRPHTPQCALRALLAAYPPDTAS